jgi:hypothetical protein
VCGRGGGGVRVGARGREDIVSAAPAAAACRHVHTFFLLLLQGQKRTAGARLAHPHMFITCSFLGEQVCIEAHSTDLASSVASQLVRCLQLARISADLLLLREDAQDARHLRELYTAWKASPLRREEVEDAIRQLGEVVPEKPDGMVFPPGLTLWWAKRPFAYDETLGKRAGKNERTRLVTTLGMPDQPPVVAAGAVTDPVEPLGAFLDKRTSQDASARIKRLCESFEAPEVVRPEDLAKLKLDPLVLGLLHRSPSLRAVLETICAASDPRQALRDALRSDQDLRVFADAALLSVGAARPRADGAGIELL